MINNKPNSWTKAEVIGLILIILFVAVNAYFQHDCLAAVISAICGITYTFIAGKGNPICYIFGVFGSGFYCYLAFDNALWGNLLLYLGYYIPMQIIGFFKWNQNLKLGTQEIVKISLPKRELYILLLVCAILICVVACILYKFNDTHPILDSITTVLSLGGMYLTVRRTVEQWQFWFVVNTLSLLMWVKVALSGAMAWSTVIMWSVYVFLSIYFYINWQKEINSEP